MPTQFQITGERANATDDLTEQLMRAARKRDGAAFICLLQDDDQCRLFIRFLEVSDGDPPIPGDKMEQVYCKAILAIKNKVDRGGISDHETWQKTYAIFTRTVVKYKREAWRHEHPMRNSSPAGNEVEYLLVSYNIANHPSAPVQSETEVKNWFSVLDELDQQFNQQLGSLRMSVFDAVNGFIKSHGTDHGAFSAVSRRFRLDENGQLYPMEGMTQQLKPLKAVVARVKAAYIEASEGVCRILESRGISVPKSLINGVKRTGRKRRRC